MSCSHWMLRAWGHTSPKSQAAKGPFTDGFGELLPCDVVWVAQSEQPLGAALGSRPSRCCLLVQLMPHSAVGAPAQRWDPTAPHGAARVVGGLQQHPLGASVLWASWSHAGGTRGLASHGWGHRSPAAHHVTDRPAKSSFCLSDHISPVCGDAE